MRQIKSRAKKQQPSANLQADAPKKNGSGTFSFASMNNAEDLGPNVVKPTDSIQTQLKVKQVSGDAQQKNSCS